MEQTNRRKILKAILHYLYQDNVKYESNSRYNLKYHWICPHETGMPQRAECRGGVACTRCFPVLLFSVSLLLNGCSTMHLPDYPVRSFQSYPNTKVDCNIGIIVQPLTNPEKIKQYFGTNLRSSDVLPVFVLVENHGSTSFLLSKERIVLVSEVDDLPQISHPDRTKSEILPITIGAVGMGDSILFTLISAKLGSDAKEINHNLVVKELRTKTVSPGADTKGFVYFSLPKTYNALDQLRVRISITEVPGENLRTIEIPLTVRR